MKQITPSEHVLGDNTFYVRPFGAFTAARITGDLGGVLIPLLGAVAPFLGGHTDSDNNGTTSEKEKGLLDTDVSKVAPAMAQGLSSLSGEKLEHLLRELLTDYNNIAYKPTGSTVMPIPLTFDEANEVFCGDVQDMFVLAFYVIKKNFSGFFKKVSARFGLQKLGQMVMGEKPNTDTST